jgi:hypothetical protein
MLLLVFASPALAQEESGASRFGKVLLGGAAGLGLHEAGHLVANWAFEEKVRSGRSTTTASFFGCPTRPTLPRREYAVSSGLLGAVLIASRFSRIIPT